MNNFEFANYLTMKGYFVYDEQGLDIEALLFEDFDPRPINYEKLKKAAEKEGYILTEMGWMKQESKLAV